MAYGFMAHGVNDFYESGPFPPLNFFLFMIKILFFLFKILNNMVVNVILNEKMAFVNGWYHHHGQGQLNW